MVRDILNEVWGWFKESVGEIVGTIVDAVLKVVDKIVKAVDEALEFLWRNLVKPVLDLVLGILGRIFGFAWDVVEVVYSKVVDAFKAVYGFVSVHVYEIELRIHDIVVSAVRMVYDVVTSMFVNVYNVVRSLYVGLRDVTSGFILNVARRVRERLHTIITVDLWILGCWKAFQGSLESFSFGDFLRTAVLCMVAPVASGYIAGIITSLTPMPGTEFPGFIPSLEFPELRSEDMPGFSVVTPPPVSFPAVGVSALPYALVMDLNVLYEVVGAFVLSDSVGLGLRDVWVVPRDLVLSDDVGVGFSDVWSYMYWRDLDLGDDVGLSLVDGWGYGVVSSLSLGDLVDLGLLDGWGYGVGFSYDLSDGVGIGLGDSWVVWMDEIQLVGFAGVGVFYPAVVDVVDSPAITVSMVVSYPAVVDVVDSPAITVDKIVSYPATVDSVDLVVGAGVSVG